MISFLCLSVDVVAHNLLFPMHPSVFKSMHVELSSCVHSVSPVRLLLKSVDSSPAEGTERFLATST